RPEFQEGDQVMLLTQKLMPAADLKRNSRKLVLKFIGSYRIEKKCQ
ncbi:17463_t:CDS:1, partial [Racocetra persica]